MLLNLFKLLIIQSNFDKYSFMKTKKILHSLNQVITKFVLHFSIIYVLAHIPTTVLRFSVHSKQNPLGERTPPPMFTLATRSTHHKNTSSLPTHPRTNRVILGLLLFFDRSHFPDPVRVEKYERKQKSENLTTWPPWLPRRTIRTAEIA